MAVTAKIAFNGTLPYHLEQELVGKRGFHVLYRINDYIVLTKGKDFTSKPDPEPPWDSYPYTVTGSSACEDLPDWRMKEISAKCYKIYDLFVDPYNSVDAIKHQIKAMCLRSNFTELENEYVNNWLYDNVI